MSSALQKELIRLMPYADIPSYADRISHIKSQLSSTAGVTMATFTSRNDEQDLQINRKSDRTLGAAVRKYYVGGALGNNENNGLTKETPVSDLNVLLDMIDHSQPNAIELLGNIEINASWAHTVGSSMIEFRSSESGVLRDMVFKNGSLFSFGSPNWRFVDIRIINDRRKAGSCIAFYVDGSISTKDVELYVTNETVAVSDSGIFSLPMFSNFRRANTFVSNNANGRVLTELVEADYLERAVVKA